MAVEKQFSASGVNLNYVEHGPTSAAPLVMLHGGAWRWQEYLSLIPSLGRRWHTYAVDLRGNGRSGWVTGRYRLADFADDNTEFVEQSGHVPSTTTSSPNETCSSWWTTTCAMRKCWKTSCAWSPWIRSGASQLLAR